MLSKSWSAMVALGLFLGVTGMPHAQTPVKLLVGFPTGGAPDVVAAALRGGLNVVDGALHYRNLASIGEGLRASGVDREGVFVAVKGGLALEREDDEIEQARAERDALRGHLAQSRVRFDAVRLLLEGGGEFNAAFLEQGLVDTIYLTLAPLVIRGVDAPTWLEGKGFPKGRFPRFHLADCQRKGEELYLTYQKTN